VAPSLDCGAAVLLWSDVGNRLGECPVVAGKVLAAVLPLAVHVIGWLVDDGGTSAAGTLAVRSLILDANHDRHGYRLPGDGRASRGGWLGDDARVLPVNARPRLLLAAKHPRDRLGLFCLLQLGLRRGELAAIQFRDFDRSRGLLRVYGKGQKERLLPLRGPILAELRLCLSSDLPHVARPPEGDDYLLYPIRTYADGNGSEGQLRRRLRGFPKDRPSPQSVHRWWYRQAQHASLVGPAVTSGLNMHQARHTFAMELRHVAGIDAASHALGHADLSTTLGIYGHRDSSDARWSLTSSGWSEAFPPKRTPRP
jgi:integrase